MNRISLAIPDSRIKYSKSISKFDWRVLTDGGEYTVNEDAPVIMAYNYCLRHQHLFNDENDNIKGCDSYAAKMMRQNMLDAANGDLSYAVNSLVAYMYSVKRASNKKLLWDCFGWEIVENIKANTASMGNICPICGRRFQPNSNANTTYCSTECAIIGKRQYDRKYRKTKTAETLENTMFLSE